jgi:hypothetical protein
MSNKNMTERLSIAKGAQPTFFPDPSVDALYAMVVVLMEEVSVLRDRLDTHERLAERGVAAGRLAVEDYAPDESVDQARDASRERFIARMMRPVQQLQLASLTNAQRKYEKDVARVLPDDHD